MTVFLALAICLALLALGTVLHPLWRARPVSASLLIAMLALSGGVLYRIVGTPDALDPALRNPPTNIEEAIAQLEASLRRDPTQTAYWQELGLAYAKQERFAKARDAYARAAALESDNVDIAVVYAESRALADPQRRFDAEANALLERALRDNPQHQRARWFLGIAQRQAGRPADAARTWEPLLTQIDAKTAAALRPQIEAARNEAGLPPLPAVPRRASDAGALTVKVALDPNFAARVRLRGDASVFVIARVPGGPPMPVAVEKRSLQELPLTVTLDDADSPMPTQKLSALKEVEVFARLSASGDASRQQNDLESMPVRVALPATKPVELIIGARP